jgi:iron complex outermembrane receptor protein
VTAQAYLTNVDHWMTDERRTSSLGPPRSYSMGTFAHALTWGGKLGGRIGRTTGGIELYRRLWDARTELAGMQYAPQPSIPGVRVDVLGAYADWSRILGDRVLVEAGARFDEGWSAVDEGKACTDLAFAYFGTRETGRRDLLPSGKLKVSWRPVTGFRLALAVGHAARVPEGSERYFSLTRLGTDGVGNPTLAPGGNTGVDASVAWRGARFSLRASGFVNRIDDYITVREAERLEAAPDSVNARARTWANVDATLVGGEASGSLALATAGWAIANAAVGVRKGPLALTFGATNVFDRTYTPHLSYQRDPFRTGVRVLDPGRSLYVNASGRF